MNAFERMTAAIRGESFDRYPYLNTHPFWSMMPYLPKLTGGLTWVHGWWGTDEERMRCSAAITEKLDIDWMQPPVGTLPKGRYAIEMDGAVPVLIDTIENTKTRKDAYPEDKAVAQAKFTSASEVEALPAPATDEDLLANGDYDVAHTMTEQYGKDYFLLVTQHGPFACCYYTLGFDALMQALTDNHALLFALLERHTEQVIQHARAAAKAGMHGMRFFEIFCSADLISESDYLRFAFPYEKKMIQGIREAGLISVFEMMGWAEPRLPHIAKMDVDVFYADATLKNHRNDMGEFRKVLGEDVCLLGNIHAYEVIERGDETTWRQAIATQVPGVGGQRRYGLCNGTPTTWATSPDRLRRFGEFARTTLAEMSPLPALN